IRDLIVTGVQTCALPISLARSVFADDIAHTVLAVPIAQDRATMHLDTVCTMVAPDAVVMYPLARDELVAFTLRPDGDGSLRVDEIGRASGRERVELVEGR